MSTDKPKRPRGRPVTTGETPKRYFRSPDELWKPAMAKADSEGTTLTAVLNDALRRYLATKSKAKGGAS